MTQAIQIRPARKDYERPGWRVRYGGITYAYASPVDLEREAAVAQLMNFCAVRLQRQLRTLHDKLVAIEVAE